MIINNVLFYGIGLLAFLAIGYVIGFMQTRIWSDERNKKSLNFQRNIVKGKISEQIAPYLPSWPNDLNPSEAKFLGDPIDFIVFKGLDNKNISEVIFVEVKSGRRYLNNNENSLREAIEQKRVRYASYKIPNEMFSQSK